MNLRPLNKVTRQNTDFINYFTNDSENDDSDDDNYNGTDGNNNDETDSNYDDNVCVRRQRRVKFKARAQRFDIV